ncbi:MAG TPA: ABC transporter substrate-binding protein [Candidatus Limnocylindrales bacterium]|jgi:peptide/nickel transport system substrate-binding protein|nr:ABC transporter substrate-binding protein [Candidatus Limnocylindrales bacterium]
MKVSRLASLAAVSLVLAFTAQASSRPRYGGTAHVVLRDRVNTLDPLGEEDHPATRDRMMALVFEGLTSMDAEGRLRPGLATWWQSDANKRVWHFHLRLAQFHDGSALTASDAVASLQRSMSEWKITATDRQTISIDATAPAPHLPELLALPRFAIAKKTPENTLFGTGPYKFSEWQPGERLVLTTNDDYWGGRPFPDAIEFQMGVPLRDQLLERQLGPYAAAELTVDQVRSLEQSSQNVMISRQSDLFAIVFLQTDDASATRGRKPVDPRIREALANTVNRNAITNVILQKRAAAASGLLPQWLTGYESLFPANSNIDRAKELRSETAALIIIPPIALAYDASEPTSKLLAERIALDAREAGIVVQPFGEAHVGNKQARSSLNADAVLVRLPLASTEPSIALAARMDEMGLLPEHAAFNVRADQPEQLFDLESKTLQSFRVIPIAHASQAVWLSPVTHNWQLSPTGTWQLDQLWVEGAR